MTYATEADTRQRVGAAHLSLLLADLPADQHGPVLARALADAAGLIDAHLSRRYRLPLAVAPAFLVAVAVDIALYRLAVTWDRLTDEARRRYEDAIKLLQDIAAGRTGLAEAEPQAAPGSGAGGIEITAAPRRFTRNLSGF